MAAIGTQGTVTEAAGFNPEADVQKLREAMKGAGTDEAAITAIVAHRTIAQRQRLKEAYKQSVGKDLADDLSSELSGNFRSVVLGLLMLAPVYDAHELRNAMKGAGTEEACLVDILASRTNDEIKAINAFYMKHYEKSLESDVCGDTSGMFRRVLVSLLTAGRDESEAVDEAQAVVDAKEIFEAGEARWGTDEVKFLTVLCVRNRKHLLRGICRTFTRSNGERLGERQHETSQRAKTRDLQVGAPRSEDSSAPENLRVPDSPLCRKHTCIG